MAYRKRLKIKVIKKLDGKTFFDKKLPITPKYQWGICGHFNEGEEFIVEDDGVMPKGFCPWAWIDLARVVDHLQLGGDYLWYEEKGAALHCCTDALMPVIFKLERLEE